MPRQRRPGKLAGTPYERRNRAAQALGYRNYYDYRTHAHGTIPAGQSRPEGEARQRLRGHLGTSDLLRWLREGDVIVLATPIGLIETDERGRFVEADKIVLPASGRRRVRTFRVRRLTRPEMAALIEEERRRGATWTLSPSRDQRRLIAEAT
ncbi:MAG TPA: hypothetical protein VFG23_19200 [Polyangia bacterium]|nr:hypothetical protein [Polyangia bacterium]